MAGRWFHSGLGVLTALLLVGASAARAEDCSEYPGGIIDGAAGTPIPSQIQIDRNCTIRNYPASNPLTTNFSFLTQPGQTNERWLIIFDNVVHTGQMACNSVAGHKIWFTNGSSSTIQEDCQNLLIPVEKIDKQNAAGESVATVGVPFTYRLTMPVLFDPATTTVINTEGSVNDLHGITLTDDLNALGVDISYVSHEAYWLNSGTPVFHTFSNSGGLLTFDDFPIVPAGEQIVVDLTLVLEDTPGNTVGTQFVNVAKWDFGRLIDGVFYEPLPGEWGIAPPMTIGGPALEVTKTGPATLGRTLNLGEWGEFAIDVRNTGLAAAWDLDIVDRFPNGPKGGMCDEAPEVQSARVYLADGETPAPGKGPLIENVDYRLDFEGAPACELTLTMLTPAAVIGAGERLIVRYRARLDADSEDGEVLTNVAGVTRWFNGPSTVPERQVYNRTVTNGTVGTADHQDAHSVTVGLYGYFFEKTVENLTTGESPASVAGPGDRMRYSVRLQTTNVPLSGFAFYDELGAMNAGAVFRPGSLEIVPGSLPPGAIDASNPNGGTNGAGVLDVRNLYLPADSELTIRFDVTLAGALADGTFVANQADLVAAGSKLADSDDPTVNGQADPGVAGDEDPTRFLIEVAPAGALAKANTQPTATIGEQFSYRLTVPAAPHSAALHDVRIFDDLAASAADLRFVEVRKISGPGAWSPENTGVGDSLLIEDPGGGIDIPAGAQAVIEITVALEDTSTNVAGLTFSNRAHYSYNQLDGDDATRRPGDPATTAPMTVVEPDLQVSKQGPLVMRPLQPGTFTVDVHNVGGSPAHAVYLRDRLPDTPDGGTCDAAPVNVSAQVLDAAGGAAGLVLTAGTDYALSFAPAPACEMTLELRSAAAVIGPEQILRLSYDTYLDADTALEIPLTNVAGATDWRGLDPAVAGARSYSRALTDGSVGVADHEDAHTVLVNLSRLTFEKVATNVTRSESPAVAASPGDTVRYRLYVENVGAVSVDDFTVADELDRLNGRPTFEPGSLTLVSVPPGASAAGSNAVGGSHGTGIVEVAGLNLGVGENLVIEFEATLGPILSNGSYVADQAQVLSSGFPVALSDDPNFGSPADPDVTGDEDPTRVRIESAPYFEVEKTSTDIDGDPDLLLAGDRLRYRITVRNVGNDHASDTSMRDQIPANTSYVSGSTRLNGAPVADAADGLPPLAGGMPISSPADDSAGSLSADPADLPSNVAVIEFEVRTEPDLVDGTVIANQAFVSAPLGGVVDRPSDDPDTEVEDDPTRDVIGSVPLIFAEKAAVLEQDYQSAGVVDPGDVLRYTIRVYNNAVVDATGVVLTDQVPANTTYVADSLTLNGEPVGQPDGGTFLLAAGLPISSEDLTPPLPGVGEGVLTGGYAATVRFDLRVDDGVPTGTVISNQALVATGEVGNVLTDGDGNPATGPEPTLVVVGPAQQLAITKQVAVVGGGPALAGSLLEYLVRVRNIGPLPALGVRIVDDLDDPVSGQLRFDEPPPTVNGTSTGVVVDGSTLSVDYGDLAPEGEIVVRFLARLYDDLAVGTRVINQASAYWNDTQRADAMVAIDVGAIVGVGVLNGHVWHDADFDDRLGAGERALEGWRVELYRNDRLAGTATTDVAGAYRLSGLAPNYLTEDALVLEFVAPDAGASSARLGRAYSADFTNELQRIRDIVVEPGSNLLNLDLPIDPNGVVYDSVTRRPLAGVTLTLVGADSGAPLPESCLDDPSQQGQVTRSDGYYKFDLNFSDASCASGGSYRIRVDEPSSGYTEGYSEIIPPVDDGSAFDVAGCPLSTSDAVPATDAHCEVQASELPPATSVPAQSEGTRYYVMRLRFDGSDQPGSAQIFNNHIPVDPVLEGAVAISKTTPMVNVIRGQMVPYTITVTNTYPIDLQDVGVIDRFPPGFRYVEGSARVDGVPVEPTPGARELIWDDLSLPAEGQRSIQLLLAVGAGVTEGEFVNRARAVNTAADIPLSGEATATVRLVPDPTFDCTDVIGKVFDDDNRNGVQDAGEPGLAGVRLVTPRGLAATTDAYGRYHITCAITPREDRGSNFVLKLDDRTLPSGFRMSSDTVQIKRATRGKALRFNFGASIHRVIGLELADAVFEPGTAEIRPLWQDRFDLLMEELQKGPAVLRLTYLAELEEPALVSRRVAVMKREIETRWRGLDCCYRLELEHDVFWRLGHPADEAVGLRGRNDR